MTNVTHSFHREGAVLSIWILIAFAVLPVRAADSDSERSRELLRAVRNAEKDTVLSLLAQHGDANATQADGSTALAHAAFRGDLEIAGILLRNGANVNLANEYRETPLSLATATRDTRMVEKLLVAGADPNATRWTGETSLMTASHLGDLDTVEVLLAHGADINRHEERHGQTALMWAAAQGHSKVVSYLVKKGANILATSKVVELAFPIQPDGRLIIGQYKESKGGYTALLFAVQAGDMESIRILLAAGDNVNRASADGVTPLLLALFLHGDPEALYPRTQKLIGNAAIAKFLLEQGANPNASDIDGYSPLHAAIFLMMDAEVPGQGQRPTKKTDAVKVREAMEVVLELLARGADPNARIKRNVSVAPGGDTRGPPNYVGATPLMMAALLLDVPLMRLLVAKGADARLKKDDGTTVLMDGAGSLEAATFALEAGADLHATIKIGTVTGLGFALTGGATAMHAAARVGADDVVRFLAEKGLSLDAKDEQGKTPAMIAETRRFSKTAALINELIAKKRHR